MASNTEVTDRERKEAEHWEHLYLSNRKARSSSVSNHRGPFGLDIDRIAFGVVRDSGVTVYAHPSDGSVIIKENADLVDMQFLGLDRFSPENKILPAREEDAFAKLLLKAGGIHWRSMAWYLHVGIAVNQKPDYEEMVEHIYGWPGISTHHESPHAKTSDNGSEAGVWVIRDSWNARFELAGQTDMEDPPELGRLRMATTMDERIEIMKSLGAKFYANPNEYEGLKKAYDPAWPEFIRESASIVPFRGCVQRGSPPSRGWSWWGFLQ